MLSELLNNLNQQLAQVSLHAEFTEKGSIRVGLEMGHVYFMTDPNTAEITGLHTLYPYMWPTVDFALHYCDARRRLVLKIDEKILLMTEGSVTIVSEFPR